MTGRDAYRDYRTAVEQAGEPGTSDDLVQRDGETGDEFSARVEDWMFGPQEDDGHEPGCDGEWHADMDGSVVSMCSCPNVPCDGSVDLGPSYDPYGAACELTRGDHAAQRTAARPAEHLAVNPLPGPGPEPQYVVWQGGGWCAGDPVPPRQLRALGAAESAALRGLAGEPAGSEPR